MTISPTRQLEIDAIVKDWLYENFSPDMAAAKLQAAAFKAGIARGIQLGEAEVIARMIPVYEEFDDVFEQWKVIDIEDYDSDNELHRILYRLPDSKP